jgi:hypothetical protein
VLGTTRVRAALLYVEYLIVSLYAPVVVVDVFSRLDQFEVVTGVYIS